MDNFTIPPSGTFILQATLAKISAVSLSDSLLNSSTKPYTTNIALLDGYDYELTLECKKQVLVNSTTTTFKYSTVSTPTNMQFDSNVLNIIIPTESINENQFYVGKITMLNSSLSNVVYTFQLTLDRNASAIPMMKQASIVFDDLTYTLLIQNQFRGQ